MHVRFSVPWLAAMLLAAAGNAQTPSELLLESLEPPALARIAAEVLERNPSVARARHRAAAAAARAPRVRALPDPMAALTLFVLPPETRVGPQQLTVSLTQKLPWFGKLPLREQAALYGAAAAEAEIETRRLTLVTETRKLFYELAFHEQHEAILRAERDTLVRYEEAARARYSAGTGLQQEILRIQAQITRLDTRFLEISEHRAAMTAALNSLRDRPAETPVDGLLLPEAVLSEPVLPELNRDRLRRFATARPELAAADARIAQHKTLVEIAEKQFKPDFNVGLGLTFVGRRDDVAGRAMPPEDDGDDILSLTGSMNLPVRRGKLEAGLKEALAGQRAAEEEKRLVLTGIERSIGEATGRLPLLYDHWKLLDKVLSVQAREALRSAETAYTTGKLNAVDLLDAEVVLLDVRTAAQRTITEVAVSLAELEGAVGRPLTVPEDVQP